MINLDNGYYIKELTKEEFLAAQGDKGKVAFANDHAIFPISYLSEDEREVLKKLNSEMDAKPYVLHLAAFDKNDELIGWCYGRQEDAHRFYMCNSGVVESHRRKGIYSALLKQTMKLLKEKGFQVIYSRHNATNNAVLIPKLKAGFRISNMELCDMFGVLVHLKYYTNPLRRKILDYRAGQLAPDEELQKLFKPQPV